MSIPPDPAPAAPGEGRAVLVHLAAGIGNLVFATPLLAALEALGYEADLLLHADYADAAGLFSGWSAVRRVHPERFPAGAAYHRLVPAVPPFYWPRLGTMYRGRSGVLPRPADALFHRDEQAWYLAFAHALGWPADRHPVYRLPVAPAEEHGVGGSTLVLAPGCKTGEMAAKRWPRFAALAERFADVVVVGTPDDLTDAGGKPLRFPAHVRSLAGALSLRATAEVLAAAGAVVANDSGLGHVAGAVGAPTVLLFGPTSEQVLGRFPENVTVLRAGLPCEPCWTGARLRACAGRVDCLGAIETEVVEVEVRRLLGSAPAPASGPPAPRVVAADPAPEGPLVSCIMPTADRRRFVPRAILHFLRQDHPHRELVIVDDGEDAVGDLVPDDPRIRYHRVVPSPTLGAKRNLACSLARGELLAHWDDDDWMADDRLSRQVAALEAAGAEVCGLAVVRYFEPVAGRAWEYRWPERSRPWVGGNSLLYRRSAWERRPFPALDQGEDTRWVWRQSSVLALRDPRWMAALVHARNTSPKRTAGSRWHAIPLETVRAAMGDDWGFYDGMRDGAARRTGPAVPLRSGG